MMISSLHDIKAIIFDCDGVLVDSEQYSCYSLNILLKRHFNIDIGNNYQAIIGKYLKDALNYYATRFNFVITDLEQLAQEKYLIYQELAKGKLKTFTGIEPFISFVQNAGKKIAVASSGELERILFSLRETHLLNYFQTSLITTGSEVSKGKPFPDLFLKSAQKIHVDPRDCLVIEDAPTGVIAGKTAGMNVAGITNTFSKEELLTAGADVIVKEIHELLEYF